MEVCPDCDIELVEGSCFPSSLADGNPCLYCEDCDYIAFPSDLINYDELHDEIQGEVNE